MRRQRGLGLGAWGARPVAGEDTGGAGAENLLRQAAAIAALLSEKDIVLRPAEGAHPASPAAGAGQLRGDSDLRRRLDLLDLAERSGFAHGLRESGIDPIAARQVARTRDELLRIARQLTPHRALHSGRADRASEPREQAPWA